MDEYFAARRDGFDLALDLRLAQGFRRDVLTHLRDIRYGSTQSYGAVAAATGHPKAARAVGSACRFNPLPIVIPCHRVVRADGSPGEYAGGAEAKVRLLALESAAGRGTDR
jgi:methylated-DNA-[protein]-cysteine S-methyltransferase